MFIKDFIHLLERIAGFLANLITILSGPEKSRGRIKSEYYQVNYHCDSGVGCGDCVLGF